MEQLLHPLTDDFRSAFSSSPYETLAVISTPFDQYALGPEWPALRSRYLRALEARQARDGSWGSDQHGDFVPDRVITTLAALLAFARHGSLAPEAYARAAAYLQRSIPQSLEIADAKKPIAYESLLTQLLMRLEQRHEILARPLLDSLVALRDTRLARKKELLVRGRGTIHSILDAIPKDGPDWNTIATFQESDGSMGIYPSSTAALLSHLAPDAPAHQHGTAYLREAMRPDGSFPPFYPSMEFERWWSILALVQSPLRSRIRLPASLTSDVPEHGIAVAPTFSLPDVDTASMKAAALLALGYPVSLRYLHAFYRNGVFECYEHEHRISPSANIHALMAIVAAMAAERKPEDERYHVMAVTSTDYLLETLGTRGHFEDKWHLSDLYTTAHAVELFVDMLALSSSPWRRTVIEHVRGKLHDLQHYLLEHQRSDGGFGFRRTSTVEETGYATRALCSANARAMAEVPTNRLLHAGEYLRANSADHDPPLWLGKTLYRSPVIADAQRISALAWVSSATKPGPSKA